jgi:hypothetical protein
MPLVRVVWELLRRGDQDDENEAERRHPRRWRSLPRGVAPRGAVGPARGQREQSMEQRANCHEGELLPTEERCNL